MATGWNSSGHSVDLDGREVSIDVALERRAAPESRPSDTAEAEAVTGRHAGVALTDD